MLPKVANIIKYTVVAVLAAMFSHVEGHCSVNSRLDTIRTKIQNLRAPASDTLARLQDTLFTDTLAVKGDTVGGDTLINNSTLEAPVFSGGRDSIVKDFNVDGRKMIYYYGDVKVTYGDMEISSEYMAFDVDSKTVFAKGLPDTSGTIIGQPKMKQGEKTYEMESVYYNFNSEKAKIKNMITQEAEGFLHGNI